VFFLPSERLLNSVYMRACGLVRHPAGYPHVPSSPHGHEEAERPYYNNYSTPSEALIYIACGQQYRSAHSLDRAGSVAAQHSIFPAFLPLRRPSNASGSRAYCAHSASLLKSYMNLEYQVDVFASIFWLK
jgi:hypothetical protein